MKQNKLFIFLIVNIFISCSHIPSLEARHHRTPGEKVDDAIDSTKDKIDKTKDKVKDKTKEGIDKAKDGLDKLKDKIGN